MANLLFDTPWWLPTLLAGVGVILFWNGNRRQEVRLRNIGMLLMGAAVVLCTVSYFVDTDLEKCIKRSKQFAHDVEKQDWTDLKPMLDTNATVDVINGPLIYTSRDAIVDGAKAAVDRYGVKNVRILSTESEQTSSIITVRLAVLSDHDNAGVGTINTGWQFEWRKLDGQWAIVHITNLKIGNQSGDAAGVHFPKPR
jgi:hypothetical protein